MGPKRFSIQIQYFKCSLLITQVAEALHPEEENKIYIWLGLPFYIKYARHGGWRDIIIKTTHLRAKGASMALAGHFKFCTDAELLCKPNIKALADRGTSLMSHLKHTEEIASPTCQALSYRKTGAVRIPVMLFMVSQSIPSQIYGSLPQ